jgi:hypothetical protein
LLNRYETSSAARPVPVQAAGGREGPRYRLQSDIGLQAYSGATLMSCSVSAALSKRSFPDSTLKEKESVIFVQSSSHADHNPYVYEPESLNQDFEPISDRQDAHF